MVNVDVGVLLVGGDCYTVGVVLVIVVVVCGNWRQVVEVVEKLARINSAQYEDNNGDDSDNDNE